MKEVRNIMFVCLGNICRSPMAEFIFKDMLKKADLQNKYNVFSSATSSEEVGNPVYPPAKRELSVHGITCEGKRSVQLQREDYSKFDLFIGMDNGNIRSMLRLFSGDPDNKVKLMMDYAGIGGEVADPWYYGHFDKTYSDISCACEGLLRELEKGE